MVGLDPWQARGRIRTGREVGSGSRASAGCTKAEDSRLEGEVFMLIAAWTS